MAPRTVVTDARRCHLVALRQGGCSLHTIANGLGISKSVVHEIVREMSANGELEQPERIIGIDGKRYAPQRERERSFPGGGGEVKVQGDECDSRCGKISLPAPKSPQEGDHPGRRRLA
jgi:methionyl-tRNA synthetase